MTTIEALPLDLPLNATVTVRKGSRERQPRGGEQREFTLVVYEGYDFMRAKVTRILEHSDFAQYRRNDDNIFIRPTKAASQLQFVALSLDNFVSLLAKRWKKISAGDRAQWGGDIINNFTFELFVYCHVTVPEAPAIHRATASRIRQAVERVQQYHRDNSVELGPITLNHVTTVLARQPNMDNFTIPTDNTTRQAMALDDARRDLEDERASQRPRRTGEILIRVNGTWVPYEVDVASLRAALGFPAHDIFTEGIYHGYQPVPAPAVDMADVDHAEEEEAKENEGA